MLPEDFKETFPDLEMGQASPEQFWEMHTYVAQSLSGGQSLHRVNQDAHKVLEIHSPRQALNFLAARGLIRHFSALVY